MVPLDENRNRQLAAPGAALLTYTLEHCRPIDMPGENPSTNTWATPGGRTYTYSSSTSVEVIFMAQPRSLSAMTVLNVALGVE